MKKTLTLVLLLVSLTVFSQEIKTVYAETRLERVERHKQERRAFRALPKEERKRLREIEKQQRIYHDTKLTPGEKAAGFVFAFIVFYLVFDDVIESTDNY